MGGPGLWPSVPVLCVGLVPSCAPGLVALSGFVLRVCFKKRRRARAPTPKLGFPTMVVKKTGDDPRTDLLTGTSFYVWAPYVWYAVTVVLVVAAGYLLWSLSWPLLSSSSPLPLVCPCHWLCLTLYLLRLSYYLVRAEQDLGYKSRNFPAGLTLGACLPLRRSMGMDCSRKTLSQILSCFRIYHEDEAMLGRPLNILDALFRRRNNFTSRSTWLAQEALRGMKVATPSVWMLLMILVAVCRSRRGKCLRQRETDEGTSCCQQVLRGYRTLEDFTHFPREGGLGA